MFQPDYLRALIDLGEHDVELESGRIDAFLERTRVPAPEGSLRDLVTEQSRR
jgi:hypothetical protein